jgi:hypothetical protein
MPLAAGVVLAEGGERAEQKHSRDDKGSVHCEPPLFEQEWRYARAWWLSSDRRPALAHCGSDVSPIKSEQAVSGPCSVATHAATNDDGQIPILVLQATDDEITSSLLATTAPFGYALGDPLAQRPAPASTLILLLLLLPVSPAADPLAAAIPQILPVVNKVDDQIPQILPGPYPVPEEIAQIAVLIAISVAPSLSWCWACCRTNHWGRRSNRENCCGNHWQPCHCVLLSDMLISIREEFTVSRSSEDVFVEGDLSAADEGLHARFERDEFQRDGRDDKLKRVGSDGFSKYNELLMF